ncbi:MAG TPA: amidase family protein [Acidimicrobiales bacterium]|nr:amidase family protein [Acidimicrobiales bacterium]
MDDTELAWLDATALAALVANGDVTPIELVDGAIERIEALNPKLNAVIFELFDRARAEAQGTLPDGPFRGVPFLLKDLMCELAGTPYADGTAFSGDYVSTVDQELAARYVAAGFVVCGKTNAPEFGILPTTEPRRFGPSKNPWDPTRTTGGSSGGTAAAVASGMVPVAHGNDGGGSIRIPASCCGLFGLKPTRARNSLAPLMGDAYGGFIAEHVLTRSVRDSAAVLDATHGPVPGDPYAAPPLRGASFLAATTTDPSPLRIGLVTASPSGTEVDAECVSAAERAALLCETLGHKVEPCTLPVDGDAFVGSFVAVWAAGNAWTRSGWEARIGRPSTPDDLEPLTWALCEMGASASAGSLLEAVEALQRMTRDVAAVFEEYDVVLTPTLGELPVELGAFDAPADEPILALFRAATFTPFTPLFNVTGQPAASIPLSFSGTGLPVGVQAISRFGDEETILSLAAQLERTEPWAQRRPLVRAS